MTASIETPPVSRGLMGPFCAWGDVRRNWRVYIAILIAMTIWGLTDVRKRGVVDPLRPYRHMTDFTVYTEAAAASFDGRDPYEVENLRGWKYLYPPLFAILVWPLTPLIPEWECVAFFFISLLAAWGCYVELRKLIAATSNGAEETHLESAPLRTWLILAAAAVLFPTLNCLQRGQVGVVKLYPLLLGARLICTAKSPGSAVLGGVVLSFPIVLKLTPLLPVACLVAASLVPAVVATLVRGFAMIRRGSALLLPASRVADSWRLGLRSAEGTLLGLALNLVLIPSLLIGWNDNERHLTTWFALVAFKVNDIYSDDFGGDVASLRNQSLVNAVYRAGNWTAWQLGVGPNDRLIDKGRKVAGDMPMDHPRVRPILTGIRAALLGLLCLAVWRLGCNSSRLAWVTAFSLGCVGTLVLSPVARGHYFLMYLPAVVFVPMWLWRNDRRLSAWILAIAPAYLTGGHYAALDWCGRIGWLGLGTTAWLTCAVVLCLRIPQADVAVLATPLANHQRSAA